MTHMVSGFERIIGSGTDGVLRSEDEDRDRQQFSDQGRTLGRAWS